MLRWISIVVVLVLLCGGVLSLASYAGFEWWRVNGASPPEAARVEPTLATPATPVEDPAPSAVGTAACVGGREAFEAKDFVVAAGELDTCLDAHPDDVDAKLLRGRAYAAIGRYDLAQIDLESALIDRPNVEMGWEALAYSRVRTENDRGAIAALDKWIALNPNAAAAWRMRADARFRLGNSDVAATDAERACALGDPDGCTLETRIKESRRRR